MHCISKKKLKNLTKFYESLLAQKPDPGSDIQKLNTDTINSIIWLFLVLHRLGLFPEEVQKVFYSLPVYIESSLQSLEDICGQSLMLRLTENIIAVVNGKGLQKKLKTILKNNKKLIFDTDVSEDVLVNNFTKYSWQQLVYKPYLIENKQFQDQTRKIFLIIDEEKNWEQRLDSLNKDNMGLTGFIGLELGLLFEGLKEELLKDC